MDVETYDLSSYIYEIHAFPQTGNFEGYTSVISEEHSNPVQFTTFTRKSLGKPSLAGNLAFQIFVRVPQLPEKDMYTT